MEQAKNERMKVTACRGQREQVLGREQAEDIEEDLEWVSVRLVNAVGVRLMKATSFGSANMPFWLVDSLMAVLLCKGTVYPRMIADAERRIKGNIA